MMVFFFFFFFFTLSDNYIKVTATMQQYCFVTLKEYLVILTSFYDNNWKV